MSTVTRRLLLLATMAAAALALAALGRRREIRRRERASQVDSLREWENEGGTLAPASAATGL